MGYTLIPDTIKTEDDLIKYYKDGNHPKVGGTRYIYTTNSLVITDYLFLYIIKRLFNALNALLNAFALLGYLNIAPILLYIVLDRVPIEAQEKRLI